MGACLGDVCDSTSALCNVSLPGKSVVLTIDVEAWVDFEYCTVQVVELVAVVVVCKRGRGKDGEGFLRWGKLEVRVQIRRVIARSLLFTDLVEKSFVEVDQILPILDIRQANHCSMSAWRLSSNSRPDSQTLLLVCLVANDWIVDRDTLQIEVRGVATGCNTKSVETNRSWAGDFALGANEAVGNVRYVKSCVRLSGNIYVPAFHLKGGHEVFPEPTEFCRQLNLVRDVWGSLGVSYPNRLLDPDHVGQICPRIWIGNG